MDVAGIAASLLLASRHPPLTDSRKRLPRQRVCSGHEVLPKGYRRLPKADRDEFRIRSKISDDQPQLSVLSAAAKRVAGDRDLHEEVVLRRSQIDLLAVRRALQQQIDTACMGKKDTRFIIELFAGSARLTRAIRKRGFASIAIDISENADFDLAHPGVRQILYEWFDTGRVAAVWLGTPCCSWSLARRGKPGVRGGPLRTVGALIWGHPDALERPVDAAKIKLGNDTMKATAFLIRQCIAREIPCVLENPGGSRLFRAPPIRRCMRSSSCVVCVTDYCQHGTRWRKRTKLVAWNCATPPAALSEKCTGRRGMCSRGKKHVILQGSRGKRMRTARACPYPWAFAHVCAAFLLESTTCKLGRV